MVLGSLGKSDPVALLMGHFTVGKTVPIGLF